MVFRFFAATIMTYYRTDILKANGIDPAQLDTIKGFADAVRKIHDPKGVAGVAMRGHPGESSWHSTVFLKGLGGTYVRDIKNGDYYPTLDSEAAIASTELYADLLANYSIPGAVNAKYDQVVIAMQQGNAAIAMEGAPLGGRILDPTQSKVRGKVGFRVVPADLAECIRRLPDTAFLSTTLLNIKKLHGSLCSGRTASIQPKKSLSPLII